MFASSGALFSVAVLTVRVRDMKENESLSYYGVNKSDWSLHGLFIGIDDGLVRWVKLPSKGAQCVSQGSRTVL